MESERYHKRQWLWFEAEIKFTPYKFLLFFFFVHHSILLLFEESLSQLTHRELLALSIRCGESPRRYRACPRPTQRKATGSKHDGYWSRTARMICKAKVLSGALLHLSHSVA
ncbi:uncharacterized protein LACBIDRAFT_296307 [Laccaria bicolor S238N-H82]|uniref:Predicted protein n=1 Tax=Laccaria bicolor (strain S238N-H82 / ATCC MYA-4686) TaxID=486041 RepID=B0D8H0_LACBS|nr:uncharacterized protein LACBIDRAFT_296307 [Laccaria bicolor S238N-H82]EDR09077.1 predicted protein [Laccaria bicolor S238N-H82]|eukprot:XP_001880390.1 predicted protein [Laccaria bicolor S238N-H82]